jgi:hypothetical protein
VPGFAALFDMGILAGGGDVAVPEGFLNHFGITGCLVEQVAAGVAEGMAGNAFFFEARFFQVMIYDVVNADPRYSPSWFSPFTYRYE